MDEVLPPLPREAFEAGKGEQAPVPKNESLPKRCMHKGMVTLVSSTHARCQCGTGWQGPDIRVLYELLK